MSQLLQETINAAERVIAGEDSRIGEYLERFLNSPGELHSGEDSQRVYLAALLDFIGMHEESVRVLRDASDAMSRNMEGMLAAAHGQHEEARYILLEALHASTDSLPLRQQILANLATVTLRAGSIEEAEAWIEAAAVARQAGNPAVDVLIATVRASIASRRGDRPALRGAVASLKEASKSRLAELGTEHPQALAIVANMASAEIMVARADNSAACMERAIDVLDVAAVRLAAELGADHPQAKAAMASLAAASAESTPPPEITDILLRRDQLATSRPSSPDLAEISVTETAPAAALPAEEFRPVRDTRRPSPGPRSRTPSVARNVLTSLSRAGLSAGPQWAAHSSVWGSLRGLLGVCIAISSTALGAIATIVTGSEPGFLLGFFLVVGTVAAVLAVYPGHGRMILPVPALSYLVAALVSGIFYERTLDWPMTMTSLSIMATQWIANGFFAMALATVLAAAVTTARWHLWRRRGDTMGTDTRSTHTAGTPGRLHSLPRRSPRSETKNRVNRP